MSWDVPSPQYLEYRPALGPSLQVWWEGLVYCQLGDSHLQCVLFDEQFYEQL